MFGIFGGKQPIHESIKIQRREILDSYPPAMAQVLLDGEDCDQIANGFGPLGSQNNPIPVNGPMGEIKYLAKLCTRSGSRIFFTACVHWHHQERRRALIATNWLDWTVANGVMCS